MKLKWWLAAGVIAPTVLSFLPGLPAHGYGHIWFALPLLLWWLRPAQRKRIGLYVLMVLLSVLAFPHPDLGFLGWVLLLPYLAAREQEDGACWWRAAYLAGFLRAHAGYAWLGNIHFVPWFTVSLGSAAFFVVFFEGFLRLGRDLPYALRVATAWVLFEWTHSWGGLPWLLLSHTQHAYLPLIQIADVVGALGISFVMALAQAAAFEAVLRRRAGAAVAVAGALLAGVVIYGLVRLGTERETDGPGVLLVQCAVPHAVKYEQIEESPESLVETLNRLTLEGLREHPQTRLIVWPETMYAYPVVEDDPEDTTGVRTHVRVLADRYRRPVIYGVNSYDDFERYYRGRAYNSALLVNERGEFSGLYRKQDLVPMGEEFLPRRFFDEKLCDRWFDALVEHVRYPWSCDVVAGEGFVTLDAGPGLRAAPLICFEGLYPHLARGAVSEGGADLILHLVNNGWFGRSWEQRQTVASWVLRAVETRTPFLSCANCGVSCVVGPDGRLVGSLDRVMEEGFLYAAVPPRWPDPPFLAGGHLILPLGLVLACLGAWAWARRRPRSASFSAESDPGGV